MLSLLLFLAVIGFALWLLQMVPMDATIKRIIYGVIIFFVLIWLIFSLPAFFPHGWPRYPCG